jgi:hypothetical protein
VEADGSKGVQGLFMQGSDCGGSAKPGGAPAPALPSLIPGKQK